MRRKSPANISSTVTMHIWPGDFSSFLAPSPPPVKMCCTWNECACSFGCIACRWYTAALLVLHTFGSHGRRRIPLPAARASLAKRLLIYARQSICMIRAIFHCFHVYRGSARVRIGCRLCISYDAFLVQPVSVHTAHLPRCGERDLFPKLLAIIFPLSHRVQAGRFLICLLIKAGNACMLRGGSKKNDEIIQFVSAQRLTR